MQIKAKKQPETASFPVIWIWGWVLKQKGRTGPLTAVSRPPLRKASAFRPVPQPSSSSEQAPRLEWP